MVFGRGEPTRRHPGNLILREFVHRRLQEYMQTSKTNKSAIIGQVINEIRETGARYLVPLDASSRHAIFTSGCRMANRTEIRSKVSHAFRDGEKRALLRRKKENSTDAGEGQTSFSKQPSAHHAMAAASYRTNHNIPSSVPVSVSHPSSLAATSSEVGMLQADQRIQASQPTLSLTFSIHSSTATAGPGTAGGGNAQGSIPKSPVTESIDSAKTGRIVRPSVPLSSAEGPHIETPLPSKSKQGNGDDLLSFATILTSLRETSPQQPNEQGNASPTQSQQALQNQLSPASSNSENRKTSDHTARKLSVKADNRSTHSSTNGGKVSMGRSSGSITKNLEAHCRETDIVFGRGAPLRRHPGNIQFRKVVESYSKEYKGASKHEKTEIIRRVIEQVEEMGARFLIMEDDTVKGASPDEIRMKVSHRFRDLSKGVVRKSLEEHKEDGAALSRRMKSSSPTSAAVTEIHAEGSFVQAV